MLYQLYEAQRQLIEPFADMANAASHLYGNPYTPMGKLPMASRISAAYGLFYRLGKDYEKPEFNIGHIDREDGSRLVIDEQVSMSKPFCDLRRFKRLSDKPEILNELLTHPAVIIFAPLSGHHATLERDTVRTMLEGHKVYITDWTDARMVPTSEGVFHLDDYVNYVQEFIRHVQAEHGNCHLLCVCQSCVPVLGAVSLMATHGEKLPLSMVLMGGPVDARQSPTDVNQLAMNHSFNWFDNRLIYHVPPKYPGAGRRVYPGFMQHAGFISMNPGRHASSHYDYFLSLIRGDDSSAETHRKFYDEYNAVLDMDAAFYLETIKTVFQDYALAKGEWEVRSPTGQMELVRPQDIKGMGLMTVEGSRDDITGLGQTVAAVGLCSSIAPEDVNQLTVEGAGHYGIFSGRRWRTFVYPRVKAFMARYSTGAAKPAAAAAKKTAKKADA